MADDIRTLFGMIGLIRRLKPEVVHTHKSKAGALGRVAAFLCGVPVIVHTFHGHAFHGYFSPMGSALVRGVEKVLAWMTDAVVVLTRLQKQEILHFGVGNDSQVRVIASGVDLEKFYNSMSYRGSLRSELSVGPERKLVAIPGRLVPIKRHEDLIKAMELLAGSRDDVDLLVVGDGDRRQELEGLARKAGLLATERSEPGCRAHFLGNRDDIEKIYPDLDLVVLCSANEGLPMTLIEAMACGLPCVATAVGGVPDLVEDGVNGLTVPPASPQDLADAISKVLDDPKLAGRFAEEGKKRSKLYSAQRLADDHAKLYDGLCSTTEEGQEGV